MDSENSTSDTGKKIPHQKQPFIDLIESIDPQANAINGEWILKEGGKEIAIANAGRANRINVPVSLPKNYELEVEFTRVGIQPGLILPIGGEPCVLWLGTEVLLELYSPRQYHGRGAAENQDGVRHKVRAEVRTTDEGGEIKVWLNNQFAFRWSGQKEEINMYKAYKLSEGFQLGLLSQDNTSIRFHKLQYRSLGPE